MSDNEETPDDAPSAPPLEDMEKLDGYEHISFDEKALPPPAAVGGHHDQPPAKRPDLKNYPNVTEEQAREAIVKFASEHCCYGKKAAKDMVFQEIDKTSAFHYTLDTFTERRETAWVFEPYRGQNIDSSSLGPPPGPWDVYVVAPAFFQGSISQVEIPRTASVRQCNHCKATGKRRCGMCTGGTKRCLSCGGAGKTFGKDKRTCFRCHGRGRYRCPTCNGNAWVACKNCGGTGQLKYFIRMTVTWTTHSDDYILERKSLPQDLIRKVTGQVAFEEEVLKVWPMNHFPEEEVNSASARLVGQHAEKCAMERVLRQRHRLQVVPVAEVRYNWKNNDDSYFVYGFENQVYCQNYPQRCCCGCTIL